MHGHCFWARFCLSIIPDQMCWWRPIPLSTTLNVDCTTANTHRHNYHAFVSCVSMDVCVCVWAEHRPFSLTLRYPPFSCDGMKSDSYAQQAPGRLPLEFKQFYLVPKLLCSTSSHAMDARGLRSVWMPMKNTKYKLSALNALSSLLLLLSSCGVCFRNGNSPNSGCEYEWCQCERKLCTRYEWREAFRRISRCRETEA